MRLVAQTSQAKLELLDPLLAGGLPLVLGLWETVPMPPDDRVTFDSTSVTVLPIPLWRISLSEESNLAATQLSNSEALLEGSTRALDTILDRVNILAQKHSIRQSLEFGIETTLAQPEGELLGSLKEIQKEGKQVSFALGEKIIIGEEQAGRFHAFVERIVQLFSHYACVESQTEGRLWARTIVGWTGSTHTMLQPGVLPIQALLHQRALSLALSSRNSLIRTFAMAVQAALKLSLMAALPGGVVLMIPAAWKFINQVLAEGRSTQPVVES